MRFSTIAVSFIQALLTALPVVSSFHPPSSLRLPSEIVTSSDGLQIFTESAGEEGAPAGKSHSLSPDSENSFPRQQLTLNSNLPSRTSLHVRCV